MASRGYWLRESSSFRRLHSSEHVADLRLICRVAFGVMILVVVLFIANSLHLAAFCAGQSVCSQFVANFGDSKVAFPLIGAAAGILVWVYRTAAVRLGVVDLFACEIATLCRVGTVIDLVHRSVEAFAFPDTLKAGKRQAAQAGYRPHTFSSNEDYFPVFSGNSKDLELLEADVVVEVTAFYTYMKVLRDSFRQIGALNPDWQAEADVAEWRAKWQDLIYMELLSYEAARRAVHHLIEYEPEEAENTIVILMTEIVAYDFLMTHLPKDDFRMSRLTLRLREYEATIAGLVRAFDKHAKPKHGQQEAWACAWAIWCELRTRLGECSLPEFAPIAREASKARQPQVRPPAPRRGRESNRRRFPVRSTSG